MKDIEVIDFGLAPYRGVWERQKELQRGLIEAKKRGEDFTEKLLLGEHAPVYTLGFHGDAGNLIAGEAALAARGCECIRVERGGDITFHGPGQLIAYPVIDLERHGLGVKGYVSFLEDCVISLIGEYGIRGEKVEGATGIWIGKGTAEERKICAIGVKISRFVTMHGLALNVTTDLASFSFINPCGFVDKGVTSLERELGFRPDMGEVKGRFAEIFLKNL